MKFLHVRQAQLLLIVILAATTSAFSPPPPLSTPSQRASSSSLFASSSSSSNEDAADFAHQEMAGLIGAMERQQVTSNRLTEPQRREIEGHVRTVARDRPSAIPLKDVGQVLPNSKWKLGFSSDGATMGDLPKDAQVYLEFLEEGRLDYCLEFSKKTFGLNRLVAESSYTVDDTPLNPGLVTFTYENIVTDVFGFQGLGVGFFGLLKGRANYVETVFMDTMYWIERGYSPEGLEYFNVYVRQFQDSAAAPEPSAKTIEQKPSSSSTPTPRVGLEDQWD